MMLTERDISWTKRSQMIEAPEAPIFFLTQPQYLTGDPDNAAHFDDPDHKIHLKNAFEEGFVRLSDFANFRIHADALIAVAQKTRRQANEAISYLTQQLGIDVWTQYQRNEVMQDFATPEWSPHK